jgi:hypothetical protein
MTTKSNDSTKSEYKKQVSDIKKLEIQKWTKMI